MREQRIKHLSAALAAVLLLACVFTMPQTAKAAGTITFSLTSSETEVEAGDQFTVAVNATADSEIRDLSYTLTYDPELVSITDSNGYDYKGSLVWNAGDVQATVYKQIFTFTAVADGVATFTFIEAPKAADMTVNQGDDLTVKIGNGVREDGQSGVSVVMTTEAPEETTAPIEYGTAELASLSVTPGELNFQHDVTDYTVRVESGTTRVTVSAATANTDDTYTVSGFDNLTDGSNTVTVEVTSTDGSTKVYTINVVVGDGKTYESFEFTDPEGKYTVMDFTGSVEIPSGFTETTVMINGTEMRAYQTSLTADTLYLIAAVPEGGEEGLYWYDASTETIYPYVQTGDPAATSRLLEAQGAYQSLAEKYNNDMQFRMYIMFGLGGAILLLILVAITQIIKIHRLERELDSRLEDDEEEEEEAPAENDRKARKAARQEAKKAAKEAAEKEAAEKAAAEAAAAEKAKAEKEAAAAPKKRRRKKVQPEETAEAAQEKTAPAETVDAVTEPESMIDTASLTEAIMASMDNTAKKNAVETAAVEKAAVEIPAAEVPAVEVPAEKAVEVVEEIAEETPVHEETEEQLSRELDEMIGDKAPAAQNTAYFDDEEPVLYEEAEAIEVIEEQDKEIPEIPNLGQEFNVPVEEPMDPEPQTPVYRRPMREKRPERPQSRRK